jgi:HAUS augmin-like complex subunit 4
LAFRLPERVKLIIEEIEKETEWREDLYSSDRKFAEYYNVLEQILGGAYQTCQGCKTATPT